MANCLKAILALSGKFGNKARKNGRLGMGWFLSLEEFLDWQLSVHRLVPDDCWV